MPSEMDFARYQRVGVSDVSMFQTKYFIDHNSDQLFKFRIRVKVGKDFDVHAIIKQVLHFVPLPFTLKLDGYLTVLLGKLDVTEKLIHPSEFTTIQERQDFNYPDDTAKLLNKVTDIFEFSERLVKSHDDIYNIFTDSGARMGHLLAMEIYVEPNVVQTRAWMFGQDSDESSGSDEDDEAFGSEDD